MEIPDNISLTTVLAAYGALVSTIVFLWNIRKDLRYQGRLHISATWKISLTMAEGGALVHPKKTLVTVTNRGRRACTIAHVGVIHNPGRLRWSLRWLIPPTGSFVGDVIEGLPKRVEYEEAWSTEFDWKTFFMIPYGGHVAFFAEDTLGRRAFTRRYHVDQFKDPAFEDESELPVAIDDELRAELNRYKPRLPKSFSDRSDMSEPSRKLNWR